MQHGSQYHNDHEMIIMMIMIISHEPLGNFDKLEGVCQRLLSKESQRRPGVAFEVHRYEDFVKPNGSHSYTIKILSQLKFAYFEIEIY